MSRALQLLSVGAWIAFGAARAFALPDVTKPVDATKRASVSTADAVQPAATPLKQNGAIGGRVIRMSEIPIRRAVVQDERAPIVLRESRDKNVIAPARRKFPVNRDARVQLAAQLPASIPRLEPAQFRRMLSDYRNGRVPAAAQLNTEISVGEKRVSIGDINRFANPRRALEAQGIPVTSAASEEEGRSDNATVPLSAEKRAPDTPPRN